MSAWETFSATATVYSATCLVLHTHRSIGSATAQRACDATCHIHVTLKWAIRMINKVPRQLMLLMSTRPVVLSSNFDYHQRCWWHRVFLRQRTVVDVDHRDRWTQVLAVRSLSRRLLSRSKTQFLPTLPTSEFCTDFLHHKVTVPGLSCGVVCVIYV